MVFTLSQTYRTSDSRRALYSIAQRALPIVGIVGSVAARLGGSFRRVRYTWSTPQHSLRFRPLPRPVRSRPSHPMRTSTFAGLPGLSADACTNNASVGGFWCGSRSLRSERPSLLRSSEHEHEARERHGESAPAPVICRRRRCHERSERPPISFSGRHVGRREREMQAKALRDNVRQLFDWRMERRKVPSGRRADTEIPLCSRLGRDKPDPPLLSSNGLLTQRPHFLANRTDHCAIRHAFDLQFDVHRGAAQSVNAPQLVGRNMCLDPQLTIARSRPTAMSRIEQRPQQLGATLGGYVGKKWRSRAIPQRSQTQTAPSSAHSRTKGWTANAPG